MCGIAGYVGPGEATSVLLDALHVLEYRGYDSAGVALNCGDELLIYKSVGPVDSLDQLLTPRPAANVGISHTRWATHGPPSHVNAHPHVSESGSVAIVHNGVIGNAAALRRQLTESGVTLTSDTDSEVIAHLIQRHIEVHGSTVAQALDATTTELHGNYAVLAMHRDEPTHLAATAHGSPLLIGVYRDGSTRIASDLAALSDDCLMYRPLRNGEVVDLGEMTDGAPDPDGSWSLYEKTTDDQDRGGFPDYMLKEIHDQTDTTARFIASLYDDSESTWSWKAFVSLHAPSRVKFLGCGSAFHAGELAAHYVERLARVPASAESATNFLDRGAVIETDCLYVVFSQSGETIDTLLAARELHSVGAPVLAVVNVRGSTLDRDSPAVLYLNAGREVSVASTKVVTNMQLASLAIAAQIHNVRWAPESEVRDAFGELRPHLLDLPHMIGEVLKHNDSLRQAATVLSTFHSIYYLGREGSLPVVREGALKLKEISYLHAEAYHAAELKHGPLALVSPNHASVVLLTADEHGDRTQTAISQTTARGGTVVVLDHAEHRDLSGSGAACVIRLPSHHPLLDHILSSIALQALAYDVAIQLRRDVDRPRNLAKSVTVE
ncbi:MAG: glutamine--fructose-6-phosphate transaminase (isomerizing) [Rhodococcus sp. (in: high G+C Gram-positive bacteria)]|uniref:glutamine--fructose-6-phosphate transaminase (isomerizing) n=1 Tax=Rhodococcus sp. TaxID=1831 RepID=UPI002AD73C62|nr:glutamine--fructose-6-phosphate transaminase (isomerizing) [Rhodococcus sp. (in: high G+C Gram-positive bacteria)]